MNWKETLKRIWQSKGNKDLTVAQLKKRQSGYFIVQCLLVAQMVLLAFILGQIPHSMATFDHLAVLGVLTSAIALSFGMYLQFGIYSVNAEFELRLREALEELKKKP